MNQDREELRKWLRVAMAEGVGARTFARLLEHFGGIDQILAARARDLVRIPRISLTIAEKIVASRDSVEVDSEIDRADELGVRIVPIQSEEYPLLLKHIPDPPHVLYVRGTLKREDSLALAMVGSRTCSQYGFEQASRFGHLAAAAGFTIVSGLARGIDSASHRGALAGNGRTLAVLGCGLATIYPPENHDLAEAVSGQGAVISELPLLTAPQSGHFPARNRIIAGLALGTLVVEARRNSGAKTTAAFAQDYQREVLAIPGRIDSPGSELPHSLIRDGARMAEGIDDIVDTLLPLAKSYQVHARQASERAKEKVEATLFDMTQLHLNAGEQKIVSILSKDPVHLEQIIHATGLGAGPANAALTALQLKGAIKQLPGSFYILRK